MYLYILMHRHLFVLKVVNINFHKIPRLHWKGVLFDYEARDIFFTVTVNFIWFGPFNGSIAKGPSVLGAIKQIFYNNNSKLCTVIG